MNKLHFLQRRLHLYLEAEETLLRGGQSYVIGDRSLTRADLAEIRKEIDSLLEQIALLEKPRAGRKRTVFID